MEGCTIFLGVIMQKHHSYSTVHMEEVDSKEIEASAFSFFSLNIKFNVLNIVRLEEGRSIVFV
jgi:hypothetical protein